MNKLVLFSLFAFISSLAFSQDPFCEAIVVEGKSSVRLVPEMITFSINLSVNDTNYANCTELAIKEIELVQSEFTSNCIDKKLIQTVNYSIREESEHDPQLRRQVFKGYRATIPIRIKTKVDYSKNDLIFEIIKNNFKANFNLNFSLSPKQVEGVKEKLIELAVKDAKEKAQQLAKSADIKLGKISKIQYGEPQTIRNFTRSNYELRYSTMQMESASSRMNIESLNPVETEMQTNVMLAWKIEY
ncbi:MAG: SIMPL domain-containing protein [Bacteroidetes bacterium]|nr:SIMPL domain-containing protein [Bacteroidota bacterium]